MADFSFDTDAAARRGLYRAGTLVTPHGRILTPAFVPVATKATVKSLAPEQASALGAQVVLGNTYHLYLQPGHREVAAAGGLGRFMHWPGPTMTDSGGFQVFSLGAAFGKRTSKFGSNVVPPLKKHPNILQNVGMLQEEGEARLAKVDDEGVTFRSHIDGSEHRFTPERSIEIQHAIGADIIFAFDECPSPEASEEYQREAMDRTHRWAKRCLVYHKGVGDRIQGGEGEIASNLNPIRYTLQPALFGIVQGGKFENLRRESAKIIAGMDFDGFGIGGTFLKEDMGNAVRWINEILPPEKPRHLLGIGEPTDMLIAIENGCDTFDCVAPTRMGRTGTLYTKKGNINIGNARFAKDHTPLEKECDCYTCQNFTSAYLHHLFDAKEMLAATLASIHNLRFLIRLVDGAREAILNETFEEYKKKNGAKR